MISSGTSLPRNFWFAPMLRPIVLGSKSENGEHFMLAVTQMVRATARNMG
jgi:hypothetical protein